MQEVTCSNQVPPTINRYRAGTYQPGSFCIRAQLGNVTLKVILAGRCDIFSLFKCGKQYYARFWSEAEQRYTVTRETGATNKAQAGRIAQQMLQRGNVVPRTTDPLLVDYIADYWAEPPETVTE